MARRKRNTWNRIKDNSEQLKLLLIVLGGLCALLEYKSSDYISRVETATEVVEKFYDSGNYESVIALENFWLSPEISRLRRQLSNSELTPREYRKYVSEKIQQQDLNPDFNKAIRGLKSVSICAIQGRCETSTVCMHISQTIQDLRCNYREYVAEASIDNGSCILDEVNFFVDNYCKNWLSAYLGVSEYSDIKDNYCLYDKSQDKSLIGEMCVNSIIYKEDGNFLDRFLP